MEFELKQPIEHPYHHGIKISPISNMTNKCVIVTPTESQCARVRIPKYKLIFYDGVWRFV